MRSTADSGATPSGPRPAVPEDRRFAVAFDQSPVPMVLLDLTGRYRRVNAAYCALLGRPESELLGLTPAAVTHPLDAELDALGREAMLRGEAEEHRIEKRYIHASGAVVWVSVHAALVRDADGLPVEVIGHSLDITPAREASLRLQRSETLTRAVLDNLPSHSVVVIDHDLRYRYAAGPLIESAGWAVEELIGLTPGELLPADQAGPFTEQLRAGLAGESRTFEWHGNRADFTYEIRVVPLPDGLHGRPAVMVLTTNVTERAEHARELERSNIELTEFASIASHDLSEPLAVVDGYLELLQRMGGDDLDERTARYLASARGEAGRMRELISDLLDYARAGTAELRHEPVDLGAVAERARQSLGSAIAAEHATVTIGALPTVAGDASALRQVLQNLLANAIKFHGDVPPTVTVAAWRSRDTWVISVADDGIGVPPDQIDAIFDMFGRGTAGSAFKGTGIGLAICKRVAERHGGRLWVESTLGEGSTFHLALPAV